MWGIYIPAYYILVSGLSGIFVSSGAFLIRLYFNIEIRGKVKAVLSVFAISYISFKDWHIGGDLTPHVLELCVSKVNNRIYCAVPWLTFEMSIMKMKNLGM